MCVCLRVHKQHLTKANWTIGTMESYVDLCACMSWVLFLMHVTMQYLYNYLHMSVASFCVISLLKSTHSLGYKKTCMAWALNNYDYRITCKSLHRHIRTIFCMLTFNCLKIIYALAHLSVWVISLLKFASSLGFRNNMRRIHVE